MQLHLFHDDSFLTFIFTSCALLCREYKYCDSASALTKCSCWAIVCLWDGRLWIDWYIEQSGIKALVLCCDNTKTLSQAAIVYFLERNDSNLAILCWHIMYVGTVCMVCWRVTQVWYSKLVAVLCMDILSVTTKKPYYFKKPYILLL